MSRPWFSSAVRAAATANSRLRSDFFHVLVGLLTREIVDEPPMVKDSITADKTFATAAEEAGYTIESTDFFTYKTKLENDNISGRLLFDALWEKEDATVSDIIEMDKAAALAQLTEKQDPPAEDIKEQKEEIRKRITEFKQYFESQTKLSDIIKRANIQQKENLQPALR